MRKGISPVVATVILVAVALVLSVALASWVMGIWGTLGASGAIQIVSASLNATSKNLNISVINRGSGTSLILDVKLVSGTHTLDVTDCNPTLPISVNAGENATIKCNVSDVKPGSLYTIELYTSEGVVTYQVRAKGVPAQS